MGGAEAWDPALLLPESLGTYGSPCLSLPICTAKAARVLGPAWVLPFFTPAARLSQGGGCALMNRSAKFQQIVRGMNQVHPLTPRLLPA